MGRFKEEMTVKYEMLGEFYIVSEFKKTNFIQDIFFPLSIKIHVKLSEIWILEKKSICRL